MKLTLQNRLKLCLEILFIKSGHKHTAQEKMLSTFLRGYRAGLEDGRDGSKYYGALIVSLSKKIAEWSHKEDLNHKYDFEFYHGLATGYGICAEELRNLRKGE